MKQLSSPPIKALYIKMSPRVLLSALFQRLCFCKPSTLYKLLTIVLFLFASKAMAYTQTVDVSQIPPSTTQEWNVYLQAPKQALWLGKTSQWYLISLNPPNGKANVNLPENDSFNFLVGNTIAINTNDTVGWAYPVQITPKKSGSLTLPELQLNHATQSLTSPAQRVLVKSAKHSPRMELALSINKNEIYLGQSIRLTTSWTFDFPVTALKDVSLYIPSLLGETFTIAKPWNKADENSKKSIGLPVNGQRQIAHWENLPNNQVRIFFDTVIKPNNIGQFTIKPASLLAAVLEKKQQRNKKKFKGTQYLAYYNNQFFDAINDEEQVQRVISKSTSLTLNVKAIPTNAPEHFSGIIGRPILQASAHPAQVKKGEAIQYSLTLVHPDIETISIPTLTQNPSFTQSFTIPAQPSILTTDTGSKIINHSLFPRRADIAAIPEITVNYLDLESGLYRDLTISNLPIKVEDNDNFNFSDIEGSKNIVLKNSIERDPDGIWALRWQKQNTQSNGSNDFNKLISNFFNQSWLLVLLLLLPPLIVVFLLIPPMRKRIYQQRLKQPVTQLKIALEKGEDPLLHLSRYCQLRFGLAPSKFNANNLRLCLNNFLKSHIVNCSAKSSKAQAQNKTQCNDLNNQLITRFSQWLEEYQARYAQQVRAISAVEATQLLIIIDKLEQVLPRYQGSQQRTQHSKSMLSVLCITAIIGLCGLSTYSTPLHANDYPDEDINTYKEDFVKDENNIKVAIEKLHHAHLQALQLSIDSPHKGSLAHAVIAEQLTGFIDEPTLNQTSLFYDIGTSWFQAGKYGKSILWLRRAQNISEDGDVITGNLKHNLAQARAKRLDQLPDNFSAQWINQLHQITSSPAWLIFCWLGYCIFWLMVWRRVSGKDINNKKLFYILIFVSFASITQIARIQFKPLLSEAVVTSQEVISRKGPGLIFSPAFTTPLHEGAELVILKTHGQWSEVKFTNGEICWLPSRAISII